MYRVMAFAVAVILIAAPVGMAGVITGSLGNSGWQVISTSSENVSLFVDGEGVDQYGKRYVAIEISKFFVDPPDPQTGLLPSISLSFVRPGAAEAAATRIYIRDEQITNLTGVPWKDFHWVLGSTEVARFNRELTNPTTGSNQQTGWRIAPFESFAWVDDQGLGTESLSVFDGTVANGSAFTPGRLGNLVIDIVDLNRVGPAGFWLKELPTIPEPVSLLLLWTGAGVLLCGRRGRP